MKKTLKTISSLALIGFMIVNQGATLTALACQSETVQGNPTSQFCK